MQGPPKRSHYCFQRNSMNCQSVALFLKTQVVFQFYLQSKMYIGFFALWAHSLLFLLSCTKNQLVHDFTHFSPPSTICCFIYLLSIYFAIIAHLTKRYHIHQITALAASASLNIIFIFSLMGTDQRVLCTLIWCCCEKQGELLSTGK